MALDAPLLLLLCAFATVQAFPIELKQSGQIVAVPHGATLPPGAVDIPHGMRVPAKTIADATRRARQTGQPVGVDVSSVDSIRTTRSRKESHRQRMSAMTDAQISNSADTITGDGARPTRQPVDEVSRLLAMLPYALCILAVAVVFVICIVGRISRYVSAEQSSYFQDGKQSDYKTPPKGSVRGMGRGGFGRRY
mmetsp:Transcript_39310/g.78772  ORF Transcript_39310/g.78772 Transcript_39310/m.78772 type:complete len:194 (+) Transcript_39310:86-667(+)